MTISLKNYIHYLFTNTKYCRKYGLTVAERLYAGTQGGKVLVLHGVLGRGPGPRVVLQEPGQQADA